MRKQLLLAAACLLLTTALPAQFRNGRTGYDDLYDSETVHALKEHVHYLSSAALEGRKAGSEGEREAAEYVGRTLEQYGIDLVSPVSGQEFHIAREGADTLTSRNVIGFIPDLARRIYAGCDLFLMPSKTEPCGLSQMVALRYGAIPIVRETGGLRDSVRDSGDGEGNGFTFRSYNAHDMNHAIRRALQGFADTQGWRILTERAMCCDNSWSRSAGEYIRMYKSIE